MKRAVVWFRCDQRLHDNEALMDALSAADEIIPLYVFDERVFEGKTSFGFPKTDKHRYNFIVESISNLKENFQKLNADLVVRTGKPELLIPEICRSYKANWVYCNRERTDEEVYVQDELEARLWTIGVEMRYDRGKMLYHTADLPFPITQSPEVFTNYRKEVEKMISVRKPLASPTEISLVPDLEFGDIPSLRISSGNCFSDIPMKLLGGESAGLKELNYYLYETKLVSSYKETRNQMLGRDYSSKFSAYLSQGNLSPKKIYHELKKYEAENGANDSTYHLFFELLWRDFFRLIAKKHGSKVFLKGGIKEVKIENNDEDPSLFNIWKEARTGFPLIDANMKELNETGFMSNRGRQLVASFLIYEMKMNWQMGAEYFESQLIDYDPCSNYGNWQYIAGVGTDPKNGRRFNLVFQGQKHDPEASYIKHWLPELKEIPAAMLINPNKYRTEDYKEFGITLGRDYPAPMLDVN